jgi:hypothetical protein
MTSIERRQGPVESIQSAWKTLAHGADRVAEVLIQIAEDPEAPAGARVQASMAVLDRVGLSTKQEIHIKAIPAEYDSTQGLDGGMTSKEVIDRRLAELAAATRDEVERDEQMRREEAEIVDAELVD